MTVESANVRQGYMEIVGHIDERNYNRLNRFFYVTVRMKITATDGKLEYVYRLRPHYIERLSRENGLSKVRFVTTKYAFISSEKFK